MKTDLAVKIHLYNPEDALRKAICYNPNSDIIQRGFRINYYILSIGYKED
jgi:hypothetical protein